MIEIEPFGVDYERYAIVKLQEDFVKRYRIGSVLEVPASGSKAMPSVYSLGFAKLGCNVTLMNVDSATGAKKAWGYLGLRARFVKGDLGKLPFKDNSFDFVWDFTFLPRSKNREKEFKEMIRVSKNYVCLFCVNGYNVGFPVHNLVHYFSGVQWNHGDKWFFFFQNVKRFFREHGLKVREVGIVDAPCWPDTMGFRDMRLHKAEAEMMAQGKKVEWKSGFLDYMKNDEYPFSVKLIYYLVERLPIPLLLKLPYAHLYYVVGEKV